MAQKLDTTGIIYCLLLIAFMVSSGTKALKNFSVVDVLRNEQRVHHFDYLLLLKNRNASIDQVFFQVDVGENSSDELPDFSMAVVRGLQMPVFFFNELANYTLKDGNSDRMLTVVYIDGTLDDHNGLLLAMVTDLRHMTVTRVLFLLKTNSPDFVFLQRLFSFCWQHKFPHVAAIFSNYQESLVLHRYTHFPIFQVEEEHLAVVSTQLGTIFPDRTKDLHGYRMPVIVGGSIPRIIFSFKPNGGIVLQGPVGHLLQAFTQKYNCEVFEPMPANPANLAPSQELIGAVRNGTVDLSAGLTFPELPWWGYTYPFEQVNWCIMMPVEADVNAAEFYVVVFQLSAFLLTIGTIVIVSMVLSGALLFYGYEVDIFGFIVHDNCLRGALSQSFCEILYAPFLVRVIYLQICVLGILLTTWYNSYFSAYVTSAPKVSPYLSFDAVLQSNIKIVAWTPEYNELIGHAAEFKKYEPMFLFEPNYQKYLHMRDSFDTQFGYMMPSTKWNIINEQQKVFTTRLFRMRRDMCFYDYVPLCFPVHENSIYKVMIERLMLDVFAAGLREHWVQMAFTELIRARKLRLVDLSPKKEFRAMQVQDLYYIWFGYSFMLILSTIVWISELCWPYRDYVVSHLYEVRVT